MISEKEMEDAIVRNPTKYIGEEGLRLVARQYSIGRYRFDLLFEDRHGGKLIVELQRGILDRTHMFKILDYCDEFRDRNPDDFVEPMVIANIISAERKRRLSHSGIPYREIPEIEFTGGLFPSVDSLDVKPTVDQERNLKRIKTRNTKPITDSSTETIEILSFEAAGFSPHEIDDVQRAIHSFEQVVLPLKKKREAEAEEILMQYKGRYTAEILNNVFDLVDTGPIGPITGPWFGQTLSRPNRNRLYDCEMAELSLFIDKLRETGDLGSLGEWRRVSERNRGIKTGAATLFMYLHSPESYNIWLQKTHSGLLRICNLGVQLPSKEIPEEYSISYKIFNENAIAARKKFGLEAQAVDWFLFAVDEIKTNPMNPGLRSLIEAGAQ